MAFARAIMPVFGNVKWSVAMAAVLCLCLVPSLSAAEDTLSASDGGQPIVPNQSMSDHDGVHPDRPEPLISAAKIVEIEHRDGDSSGSISDQAQPDRDASPLAEKVVSPTNSEDFEDESSVKGDELPSNDSYDSEFLNSTSENKSTANLDTERQNQSDFLSATLPITELPSQETSTFAVQDSDMGTSTSDGHFTPVDANQLADVGLDPASTRIENDVNASYPDGVVNITESSTLITPTEDGMINPVSRVDLNNLVKSVGPHESIAGAPTEGSPNLSEVVDDESNVTEYNQSDGLKQQPENSELGENTHSDHEFEPTITEVNDALRLLSARKVIEIGPEEEAVAVDSEENEGIRSGRRSRIEDYMTIADQDLVQQTGSDQKPGRCPTRVLAPELCPEGVADQCRSDGDCSGASRCCSTGCARVCVRPLNSACELQRENTLRRGRALGLSETELSAVPRCDDVSGTFVEVQCSDRYCYCAHPDTGYEVPGTRARSMQEVNCSNPLPCAGYQCRMLCPYQFSLDASGCPLCRCRDPCEDVVCPAGTACVLQEASCASASCPPLPTCEKPPSLASLCPLGAPLTVGEAEDRPFLCGARPNGPACPPLYRCHVTQGHDYGVCCADVDKLVKPGSCPADAAAPPKPTNPPHLTEEDPLLEDTEELRCGVSCSHDLQCPSTQKCCVSDICGQHCIQPANLTVCMHQRMIAELLIVSEREGRGYVPQCRDRDGLYASRQCSRNGLVCWCVDPQGAKLPRSIGPAELVTCDPLDRELDPATAADLDNGAGSPGAARSGLPTSEDPPAARSDPPAGDIPDGESPECPLGLAPLSVGGMILQCDEHNPCPPQHFCTMPGGGGGQISPFCCPMPKQIESTKAGRCPYLGAADETLCAQTSVCSSDAHCPGAAKCCVVPACGGPVCVGGQELSYGAEQAFLQGPTMCEYLRDLVELEGLDLAISTPSCDADGAYERVQCNVLDQCWCVDDYGSPLPGTKVSSRSLVTCEKLRESLTCGEVLCRLGCDYGFVLDPDTGCPLCMCRDPCQDVECGGGSTCELVDIPCVDGICPPIPQCVPQPRRGLPPTCPKGAPYTAPGTNDTLTCSPRARALECPRGYACVAQENDVEGVCCYSESTPTGKLGQCPFLVPAASQACDLECSSDAHCEGDMKCCSNGCGMHCVAPILKTACQHQRTLLEHRAREAGVPARRVYLPECTDTGDFAAVQCHPATTTCWCVDTLGVETPGTRVSQPDIPDCGAPATCPDTECDLACLHGLALDTRGCPTCTCRDPCEEVACDAPQEECRIVHVACVGRPCPPLPVCLPRADNPCPAGTPLSVNGTLVQCGPEGTVCPSSHKCHLSPLGEYALCCRKPREVCYEPRDSGFCEGSIRRWHFDSESNECRSFRFGGCGGNLNNFESEIECRNACPVLSSCEKLRAKNIQKAEKNGRMTFIPKCEKSTGAWLPEQCLEELGVCWCVTAEGDQVDGSLTRGAPDCSGSARQARRLDGPQGRVLGLTNAICDEGETVHVCDKSLCEGKICLSHPSATCRINPCGGCSVEFVDTRNAPVTCDEHLTPCQRELQDALNSPATHNTLDGFSSTDSLYKNNVVFDYLHNADVYISPPSPDEDPSPSPTAFGSSIPSNSFGVSKSPEYLRSLESTSRGAEKPKERTHFARHFEYIPPDVAHEDSSVEYQYAVKTGRRDVEGGSVTPIGDSVTPDNGNITPDGANVTPDGRNVTPHVETDEVRAAEEFSHPGRLLRSKRSPTKVPMEDDTLVMPLISSSSRPRLDDTDEGNFEGNFASVDYDLTGNSVPKPGTCPNPAADVSLLTCEPRQECLQDSHCHSSAKCCFTGCGSACLQPLEIPISSSGMQAAVPMCERDGSYSRTQTSQGWSWCVDSRGAPLHHTLTRGHVRCGPRGQILERAPQSAVCPDRPGTVPRVCAQECRRAVCPAHPDAVCVADPCSDCRIAFFSPSGEQVHCEDQCSQPLTKGMCRASFRRYFHNSSSGRCEEFDYGGCQGNDNNFATMEECRQRCEKPVKVCELPLRAGECGESTTRWYYSAPAQACRPFLYTGCGGNANNFPTKLHCQAACPELVLCPLWSSTVMEPSPCSRTAACHNQTCNGYPEAVCTVEPCTCRPYFTDQHGQTVECHQPTAAPRTILAFSYEQDLPNKLSAEELAGGGAPTLLYLEGAPSVGRCELLRQHLLAHPPSDARGRYLPQCDATGAFLPTQCYAGVYVHDWTHTDTEGGEGRPRCWCVDEAGKKTHPSAYFVKGQRECEPVMVESVVVTLGFHGHKVGLDHLGRRHEKEIREQMGDLLSTLTPAEVDGQVAIVDLPDVTQVKFTLKGNGKIDAAYKLEDKVRRGALALQVTQQGRRVPADARASWFHHEVVPSVWRPHAPAGPGGALPREVVVTQMESGEHAFLGTPVVVTVVSAVLLCALVVALVLYRRHVAGTYAKSSHGSTQSLAFSDSSLDRRSISSGKFCAELEHPKLDGKIPSVTTIENEFRAVTRH